MRRYKPADTQAHSAPTPTWMSCARSSKKRGTPPPDPNRKPTTTEPELKELTKQTDQTLPLHDPRLGKKWGFTPQRQAYAVMACQEDISIHHPVSANTVAPLGDTLPSEDGTQDDYNDDRMHPPLRRCHAKGPYPAGTADLQARFGFNNNGQGMTMEAIGRALSLSRQRMDQVLVRCIAKLRCVIREDEMKLRHQDASQSAGPQRAQKEAHSPDPVPNRKQASCESFCATYQS